MKLALLFLLGAGCASVPPTIRVPVLVTPSCEPTNILERCKLECGKDHKQAGAAWENAERYRCYCTPFDAYKLPPPWRTPGPQKPAKRAA